MGIVVLDAIDALEMALQLADAHAGRHIPEVDLTVSPTGSKLRIVSAPDSSCQLTLQGT